MKKIFAMLVIICLCACSTATNNNQEDKIDDIHQSSFEEKNILAIDCNKREVNYEAKYSFLKCSFKNNSQLDVMLDNVEIKHNSSESIEVVYPIKNRLIKAQETTVLEFINYDSKSEIKEEQNLSNMILGYFYYTPVDGVSNQINLNDQSYETDMYPLDNYNINVDVDLLPMIPNFGYTIFAFKNNDTWSFDLLRGVEHAENDSDYSYYDYLLSEYAASFPDMLYYNGNNYLVFIVEKNESITEKETKYFEAIFNDLGLYYIYTDDTEGVASINNKFVNEIHLKLVPNGYKAKESDTIIECKEAACIYTNENNGGKSANNYQFSSKELESVNENAFTIDEIVEFMNKNDSLDFYMRGLDKPLTLSDANELEALFSKKTKRNIDIEGEIKESISRN